MSLLLLPCCFCNPRDGASDHTRSFLYISLPTQAIHSIGNIPPLYCNISSSHSDIAKTTRSVGFAMQSMSPRFARNLTSEADVGYL